MDLPDYRAFKALLKSDSLFRSYFTAHLNLPIFSHRFSYDASTDTVVSAPPINSRPHPIRHKDVMLWIHQERLPYFWRSPLCMEYQVARQLQVEGYSFTDVDSFLQFKSFLSGGLGYLELHYCCAVEHLKQLGHDEKRQGKLALALLHTFTRDNSRFKLPEQLLHPLTLSLYGRNQPLLDGVVTSVGVGKMVRCLRQNQQLALRELSKYWLKQFTDSLERSPENATTSGEGSEMELTDQEAGKEDDALFAHEERASSPEDSDASLPSKSLSTLAAAAQVDEEVDNIKNQKDIADTCSQSKADFFHRSIPQPLLAQSSILAHLSKSCSSEHFPVEQLNDHLLASLHCDVWAGGPFLDYLQKEEEGAPTANCLLYWQAVEYLMVLDATPESKQDNPIMQPSLHQYLVPHVTSPEDLIAKHVKESAVRRVRLPPSEQRRLMEGLPLGLGRDLLLASQRFVSKLLLKPWERFLLSDREKFQKKCVSRERKVALPSPSLSTIISDTYGHNGDENMWRAHATTMLTCCHGVVDNLCNHLPVTGLRALFDTVHSQEEWGEEKRCRRSSAGWFFRHHIVPPTVTTLAMLTVLSPHKRRCFILSRTLNRNSQVITGKAKTPPRPKTFQEVLHDPAHLKCFREFLSKKGEDYCIPLNFWQTVDSLKKQIGLQQQDGGLTLEQIHRTYFVMNADQRLQCGEPIIYELIQLPKVNIFHLLAAQGAVSHSMEERWFQGYLDHLAMQENDEDSECEELERKMFQCKERTKGLWRMFARNVISFKRGLRNPTILKQLQRFLAGETNRALSSSNSPRKLIGNKVVNMHKLYSDLSFWIEMERYRDMADIISAAKTAGSHCPEDDYILHRKAHAIVNCFIDSPVHPRIQVNVPSDIVQCILDNVALGQVNRGLFHEATLAIFSGMIYFWKKFCVHRFAPVPKEASSTVLVEPSARSLVFDDRRKSLYEGKEGELERDDSLDGGPILSFSLSRGLRAHPGELNRIIHRPNVSVII